MIRFTHWKTEARRFVPVHRTVERAYVGTSVAGLSLRLTCGDGRTYAVRLEGRDLDFLVEAVAHRDSELIHKQNWVPKGGRR